MDGGLERDNGGGRETSEESVVFIQVREKMVAWVSAVVLEMEERHT